MIAIEKYLGKLSMDNFREIRDEMMSNKIYTIKDISQGSYRTIQHWDENNLLLCPKDNSNKWRKFCFSEVVWIKIIEETRLLGVPLDVINQIKYCFGTKEDGPSREEAIFEISQKDFSRIDQKLLFNNFSSLIAYIIIKRSPYSLRIFKNGLCYVMSANKKPLIILEPPTKAEIISEIERDYETFISISITDILKEIIKNFSFDNISILQLLNENEQEVVNEIRKGSIQALTVRFKDEEMNLIETTRTKDRIDIESRFLDHIYKKGYQDISFKTENGKVVSFTYTERKKLKK